MQRIRAPHAQNELQSCQLDTAGAPPGGGQRLNALKHGHYAQSILLPGESAAEFQAHRRGLFHEFRPQTQNEAKCVHLMAQSQWEALRYGPLQAQFDGQIMEPARDVAGRISEPAAHKRLHSTIDVSVIRKRLQYMEHKEHDRLMTCQKQRRHGLVAGAVKLPEDCYMEMDGQIVGPIVQPPIVPVPEPDITDVETDSMDAGVSVDRENGFRLEQKEMVGEPPVQHRLVAIPAAAPRSDWPLHADSAAWMAAAVHPTGATTMPASGGWSGVRG